MNKCDCSGWATRNNVKCSDGRVIAPNSFKHQDGMTVPLIWNHIHDDPYSVLGHALLKNKKDGVYAYCYFNDTESGKNAKTIIEHGDVVGLSIYANHLKQNGSAVIHGNIREVSLVLAGANPEAYIDNVIAHGETLNDEAHIFTGGVATLLHSDEEYLEENIEHSEDKTDNTEHDEEDNEDNETIQEIFDSMTEKQKKAVYMIVGLVSENNEKEGDDENMKHNVFDTEERENTEGLVLSHDDLTAIISDGKRFGSLKESFIAHADENGYGIEDIEILFPDARTLTNTPEFIKRDTGWVSKVINGAHHTPFSRIKSVFANITEDEARAKGYIKGKRKKEEVFSLLKRVTTPTTIYKKQKIDRDDIVDITDFDVIAWLKAEMRMMLDEELARAALISDGRLASDEDHINTINIRPIYNDDDLYTIKGSIAYTTDADVKSKNFIKTVIKKRKDYKGSGNPTLFTTEDMLTDCLLLTDATGRDLYENVEQLAKKLRVKEIVTVPVMEGCKGANGGELLGIVVNMDDYTFGADKGGDVNFFDDFDIDYNQQKYLIETRCSGTLNKPYSAISIEMEEEPETVG